MARPRVRLNQAVVRKILRDAQPEVDAVAKRKAAVGGSNVRVVSKPHRYTARAYIETDGLEGAKAQARDHILERVIGS